MSHKRNAIITLIFLFLIISVLQPSLPTIAKPLDIKEFSIVSSKIVTLPDEQLSFALVIDIIVSSLVVRYALDRHKFV